MEDSKNTSENIQFNIGKSFGLDGKKTPIEDYIKMINDLTQLYEKTSSEEALKFTTHAEQLKTALTGLTNDLSRDHRQVLENSKELVTYLNQLTTTHTTQPEWLVEKIKELCNAAMERYKKNITAMSNIEAELKNKISDLHVKLDKITQQMDSRHEKLMSELKSKNIDFSELENGYLFGIALKTAFDSSDI